MIVQKTKEAYREAVERGVKLCRTGSWDEGLLSLNHVFNTTSRDKLPATVYSYLGYGIARRELRIREGLAMCQRAVEMEFFVPCHYLNLARCYVLSGNRRAAARTLAEGLRVDPNHRALLKLKRVFGARRQLVLRFLGRNHLINRYLAIFRNQICNRPESSCRWHVAKVASALA